jgi:hypothetical protein
MQQGKGSASVPTTGAKTIIYKILFGCAPIVVGSLGYLSALHINNGDLGIMQWRDGKQ